MLSASLEELLPIILEEIESGGSVRFKPRGKSMLPFLMEGRDEVVLKKPPTRLKKYEIPFYRRVDGGFVLHRVVDFDPDGGYVMCGDNQYIREHGIRHEQVIAVVEGVYRKGKYISADAAFYKVWGLWWPRVMRCKGILARIYHKIGRILKHEN
ncbi:MAG: S24/S26 family peptidase [Clostridia bacterium]